MVGLSVARRMIAGCALGVVATAALAAPGVASAKETKSECLGSSIVAAGSTLQKFAQKEVWIKDFHTSKNAKACSGEKQPGITYESIGSGAGLEDWGLEDPNKHAFELNRVAVVATDEPVNETQKAAIEASAGSAKETVQTIPVLQAAVAVIVHLPNGCTAKSSGANGRIVLNNVTLEGIWRGSITNWGQIKDDGDELVGCEVEPSKDPITRVVRLDISGTTHIFKKYLSLINPEGKFPTELGGEEKTWVQIDEGPENTNWPLPAGATPVLREATEGGGALVKEVEKTAGSIGYANLADAHGGAGFLPPSGGAGTNKFWVPIQNTGTATKKLAYADPSTVGEAEASVKGDANCAKEKYTNGKGKTFPPSSTSDAWNQVTTETKQKNYPICGFSYDMAMTNYKAYGVTPPATEGEAETAHDYLSFVTSTKAEGGQPLLEGNFYEALPKKVAKEAEAGAATIAFG
jgi:ABC-type phosphate transport system substrate-binding protein